MEDYENKTIQQLYQFENLFYQHIKEKKELITELGTSNNNFELAFLETANEEINKLLKEYTEIKYNIKNKEKNSCFLKEDFLEKSNNGKNPLMLKFFLNTDLGEYGVREITAFLNLKNINSSDDETILLTSVEDRATIPQKALEIIEIHGIKICEILDINNSIEIE